jgi:hypothetical protein
MLESYFDPPDDPDYPQCCYIETVMFKDGVCLCSVCGIRFDTFKESLVEMFDVFKDVELDDDLKEESGTCPHGNKWGDCDTCDYLSDIAYDTARERSFR